MYAALTVSKGTAMVIRLTPPNITVTQYVPEKFIIAVDPGSKTHGFACIDISGATEQEPYNVHDFWETEHMLDIANVIHGRKENIHMVIVENFVGNGPRDVHAVRTLKMLGFIEGFCRYFDIPVTIQNPQMRRGFLTSAETIVGGLYHYTDAMAHALAYHHIEVKNADANTTRTRSRKNVSKVSAKPTPF